MKPTTQNYNDGLLTISRVENSAAAGKKPVDRLVPKHEGIRYARRIVGMNRFWTGMQSNARIDQLVRIPEGPDVTTLDRITLETGDVYRIEQIQHPPDVWPKSLDLSLSLFKTRAEMEAIT